VIDFHCHLDLFPDPHKTAVEAHQRNVGVLSVTTTPSAWPGTLRIAGGRSAIKTALGLHPQLARERKHELDLFDKYLSETRFIGEVGLDGSPEFREFWPDQVEVFEHVLHTCEQAGNKIVSVHSRRAATHVLNFLDKFTGVQLPILHWFSGTLTELRRAVDRGCWFSVGPAMLAGAKGRDLAEAMPRDRVLLETDGPFTHLHGAVLRPWDIALARQALSKVWGIDDNEAERVVRANEVALLR
jgi:TatD DNase family protein